MSGQDDELRSFVRRAIEGGSTRPQIRESLAAAGWDEAQTNRALEAWAEVPGPLAVPRPRAQLTARDAFLYLVLFASLYLTAWHFGVLLFSLIDILVPDPEDARWVWSDRDELIRWSIAALIVAVPLYIALTVKMAREMAADPLRRRSPVWQWLGYMTMFLAALIVIAVLVTTIYSLLDGALTLRFVLKLVTVAGIAGAVFGYYRTALRAGPG